MIKEVNFVFESSNHSKKLVFPIILEEDKDWNSIISNAMILAAQDLHRLETTCPECASENAIQVFVSACQHLESEGLDDDYVHCNDPRLDEEDKTGLSRLMLMLLGLAIMSEGVIPEQRKEVHIVLDNLNFPHFLHNHSNMGEHSNHVH